MSKDASAAQASGIKTALIREIGEAGLALRSADITDEEIHAIRKKLKSARARLRLLRDAIGREAYVRENAVLRDAARPLSAVRDAKVLLDTSTALQKRDGTEPRRVLLTALAGRLQQAHSAARAPLAAEGDPSACAETLKRSARRIGRFDVPEHTADALQRSLRRIYRKARNAFAAAQSESSPENLHELRKQVKYLREALAQSGGEPSDRVSKLVESADAVARDLGDDHDLHILNESLVDTERSLHKHSVSFAGEIAERRAKLQKRALKRARKLLRRKPSAFARRVALD